MEAVSRFSAFSPPSWPFLWAGFFAAVVLLVWADLASTIAAASVYGLDAEANPIMRWLLAHDLAVVFIVHVLVFVGTILAFAGIVKIGRSLDGKRSDWYRIGCSAWIVGMMGIGILVVVNNLTLTLLALFV